MTAPLLRLSDAARAMGKPVASVTGPRPDALREIWRYAVQYLEDGPVSIQGVTKADLLILDAEDTAP